MKRSVDLSLYLVTRRAGLARNDFFEIILASLAGGVTIVQLREKESSAREMIQIGKELLALLKPRGVPLIINDRVDVAHAIGADGIHLGQSDLTVAEARVILGPQALIGLSVETLEQARAASAEAVDYLAASPIFPTRTKTDYGTPWGLEGLKQLCALSYYPVVAIGGIDATNAKQIRACGAAGVAVVSTIFQAASPKDAAFKLVSSMR